MDDLLLFLESQVRTKEGGGGGGGGGGGVITEPPRVVSEPQIIPTV